MTAKRSRSGMGLVMVVILLLAFAAVRALIGAGLFSHPDAVTPGACRIVWNGDVRDLKADAAQNRLILASADALWLWRDGQAPTRLTGTPKDFHPLSISLVQGADGAQTVMAVNLRASGKPVIDMFGLLAPKLDFRSAIEGGLLTSGGGIDAVAPDRFYAANSFAAGNSLLRLLENHLALPLSDILYFDSASFHATVQRVAMPTGVLATPDGANIYVASASERRLLAFSREPFQGTLGELKALALPMRPYGVTADGKALLVAGAVRDGGTSQVVRVTRGPDGTPVAQSTVYAGDAVKGARAAAMLGKRLFIGGANGLLACSGS